MTRGPDKKDRKQRDQVNMLPYDTNPSSLRKGLLRQEIDPDTQQVKVYDIGMQFGPSVPIGTRSLRFWDHYAPKWAQRQLLKIVNTYAVTEQVEGVSANPANKLIMTPIKREFVYTPARAKVGDLGNVLVTGKKANSAMPGQQTRLELGDRYEDLSSAARNGYVTWTDRNGKVHMAPLGDETWAVRFAYWAKKQAERVALEEANRKCALPSAAPAEPDRRLDAEILIARAAERAELAEKARRANTLHLPAKPTAAPTPPKPPKSAARKVELAQDRVDRERAKPECIGTELDPTDTNAKRVARVMNGGAVFLFVGCKHDPCSCSAEMVKLEEAGGAAGEEQEENDGELDLEPERHTFADEKPEDESKGYEGKNDD